MKTPADGDTIDADVCVVGSGSGGGVIAGTLAKQGMKVVVLEASGYFNESDFAQLELQAYQEMFWRGGPTPSADGNISMQAGTTLGGGTTINWTNCLRTDRLGPRATGRTSTGSRGSTAPTTTATSTRCSSGSARPTAAAT